MCVKRANQHLTLTLRTLVRLHSVWGMMPLAAPPTASAVLPKNVGQGTASRVGVRGNGGMVLGI